MGKTLKARRALKALKALVKLQALVRGHMVRKRTADMLRRIQTLVRVQSRVCATRTHLSDSSRSYTKSSLSGRPASGSPDKIGHQYRSYSSKYDGPSILKRCGSNSNYRDVMNIEKVRLGTNWLDRWMEESLWNNCNNASRRYGHSDDEKSDKILEVDTWKPHLDSQRSTRTFQSPRKEEAVVRTTENSPQACCSSSIPGSARRGPFTPTRSEYSMGYFKRYSGYPNYMANTESSRAKVRSQSAPRQRLEFEEYSTTRSVKGSLDAYHSSSNPLNRLGSGRLR